jgi:hypothetical protein
MGHPAGRPPSVWITQVLLLLSSVAFGVALLISVVRCLWPAQRGSCPSPVTLPELVLGLAMLACALLAFRGLQTRRRYGQLLAAALLAGSMVVGVVDSPLPRALRVVALSITPGGGPLPDPLQACGHPFGHLTYLCGHASYPQLLWAIAADLLPSLLVGVLAFRLLFSDAARRFFRTTSR